MSRLLSDQWKSSSYQPIRSCLPMHKVLSVQGDYGSIFLGNIDAAQDAEYLRKHKIGAILSVIDYNVVVDPSFTKLHIIAEDAEDVSLQRFFHQTFKFIEQQRDKTNILVHCYAGISRSATIVLAYLMNKFSWSLKFALRHVQGIRQIVCPNQGFMEQLQQLENVNKRKESTNKSLSILNDLSSLKTNDNSTLSIRKHTASLSSKFDSFLVPQVPLMANFRVERQIDNRFADFNSKCSTLQSNQKKYISQTSVKKTNLIDYNEKTFQSVKSKCSQLISSDIYTQPFSIVSPKNSYLSSDKINQTQSFLKAPLLKTSGLLYDRHYKTSLGSARGSVSFLQKS